MCSHILKTGWRLHTSVHTWQRAQGLRLSYGRPHPAAHLHVPESGLLRESGIRVLRPPTGWWDELPVLFPERGQIPFDLWAAAFFLLSRYEEYLPYEADRYGRFPAQAALGAEKGWLQLPLVDLWAARLRQLARQKLPALAWPPPRRRWQPTCDVDMAWAYLHRPWWRTLGGIARDLARADGTALKTRLRTLCARQADPFDTFELLRTHWQHAERKTRIFVHVGPWGPYDKNVPLHHPAMRRLVRQLASWATIGLHPSFRQGQRLAGIRKEKEALEKVLDHPVTDSRHHFLRIDLPRTYRLLIQAGIRTDWSMGFAERPGFRAGTAHPFPWYDLERECPTSLTVVPLALMDVSLTKYLKLKPEQAVELAKQLWNAMAPGGGLFVALWHNSTPFDKAPWWGWQPQE